MTDSYEHPYIPQLKKQLDERRIDRREFLRIATLLGMSATAAYAFASKVAPAQAQTALPKGGTLRIGMRVHEIKEPHAVSWTEASNIIRPVAEYLTYTGHDNITKPYLLEKWEASEDLKTWTLRVRKDVTWRNGKKFVADHAIWNIRRALDPKTGSSVLGLMKGYMLTEFETGEKDDKGNPKKSTRLWDSKAIEKVDDYTIRLNCQNAQLAVPEHFFHYPFFMLDPEENGAFKPGFSGTGAFTLESHEVGRRAVFKARKDYWGTGPYLDSIEYIDLGNDNSAWIAALASKQIDGLYEVDINQIDAIKALPHVTIYPATTAQTGVARFRPDAKPFGDKRVRLAMRLATDSQAVVDTVFRGGATAGEHHHVAPIHPEYAKLPPMKRDVAKAKQLLAEAGYPNGIDAEIGAKVQPAWEVAAVQVMIEQWKEAGIRVKINTMPAQNYWENWTKMPFGFTSWAHRPLGVMVLGLAYRTGVPWNESGYSNKEFDELLTRAEGILDVDKRREVVKRLQEILQEDGTIVQPLWRVVQTAYDKKVAGFKMHPTQYIFPEQLAVKP